MKDEGTIRKLQTSSGYSRKEDVHKLFLLRKASVTSGPKWMPTPLLLGALPRYRQHTILGLCASERLLKNNCIHVLEIVQYIPGLTVTFLKMTCQTVQTT